MKNYEVIKVGEYDLINFTKLDELEIEMVRRWRNNPKVRMWMYNDRVIGREEHNRFIESLKKLDEKMYYIVKKGSTYIGVLSFTSINWQHRRAYFGIYTNPELRISGVGSNLMKLALYVAFKVFNLHSLRLEVIENNTKAINLYKKFGFKEEGRLKDFVWRKEKWLDVIVMSIINPWESDENENQ